MRMILTIALPVARRGITAAVALAIILLSSDFAVSVLAQTPGNQVMGTLLYELEQSGSAPQVAVMALIITSVTAVILALTLWSGGRRTLESL